MCKIESSAVFGTFDRIAAVARRHSVGGVLQGENLKGLYRRAARIHECTAAEVREMIMSRPKEPKRGGRAHA